MKVLMAHNFYQQPGGEDQSFLAEAADSYRKALALEPGNSAVLVRLAQTKRFRAGDPDLAALEAAYAAEPATGDMREALAFALGKALDDTGDFTSAIEVYLEANRLRRGEIEVSLESEARSFAATMATVTADFIDRHRGHGDPSQRIGRPSAPPVPGRIASAEDSSSGAARTS